MPQWGFRVLPHYRVLSQSQAQIGTVHKTTPKRIEITFDLVDQ